MRRYTKTSDFFSPDEIDRDWSGLTASQRKAVFQHAMAGRSVEQLAKIYRVHPDVICRLISKMEKEIRDRYRAGDGVVKLARRYGLELHEVRDLTMPELLDVSNTPDVFDWLD
jgi:hypothetical protein